MRTSFGKALSGAALTTTLLLSGANALAQEPGPPPPAGAAEPAPANGAAAGAGEARGDEVRDGFRLRGGFSLNGGMLLLPANPTGGAASFAGRFGLQFNHYFSIYYQNTPLIGGTLNTQGQNGTLVFADYNSFLANLTFFHALELGFGPSIDVVDVLKGAFQSSGLIPGATGSTETQWAPGMHGRLAFNIGGLSGNGPRRSGFALGIDAHPVFLKDGTKSFSLTVGVGADWY